VAEILQYHQGKCCRIAALPESTRNRLPDQTAEARPDCYNSLATICESRCFRGFRAILRISDEMAEIWFVPRLIQFAQYGGRVYSVPGTWGVQTQCLEG
jgi:hypothetical protein